MQTQATVDASGASIPAGVTDQTPGLAYRTFWNWDHSTNWDVEQIGVQEIGVMNPYAKPADGFLSDYKRCIDFMSRNRIAAVTVFGFFRESHGGVAAAQEICRYANERGVRIMPGVAINAYGGVYWESDHPYNLATWLRKHPNSPPKWSARPDFSCKISISSSISRMRDTRCVAVRSRPENQAWMEEGIAWLAETCEIGG